MAPHPEPPVVRRAVASLEELRARYRPPTARSANKVIDHIDAASARLIGRSPLVMLSSSDSEGRCYVSPRGGPPGFVFVLDERHVAVPDLGGNNRLDSFTNVVANPHAGLLFIVPGKPETLHLQGPAVLTDDDEVLDRFTTDLRRPGLALVVETEELYAHCAKALLRSRSWEPESWGALADAPDLAEIYSTQKPGVFDADELRAALAQSNADGLAGD